MLIFVFEVEFTTKQAVVGLAFCAREGSGDFYILDVPLTNYDVIDDVPNLCPRVHPGIFVFVFELEEGVCDAEGLFCAELKQQVSVFVAGPISMRADHSSPG